MAAEMLVTVDDSDTARELLALMKLRQAIRDTVRVLPDKDYARLKGSLSFTSGTLSNYVAALSGEA